MSRFDLRNQFADIELENDRSQNDFRILLKGVDLKPDETKKVIDCSLLARQETEDVLKANIFLSKFFLTNLWSFPPFSRGCRNELVHCLITVPMKRPT